MDIRPIAIGQRVPKNREFSVHFINLTCLCDTMYPEEVKRITWFSDIAHAQHSKTSYFDYFSYILSLKLVCRYEIGKF